jgi:glycosyltransferase involved in cell wall biosynthesis
MPKVSVIVPAYDRARFVGEAVRSVLAQSLPDFELIVVDDGSDDDTPAVIEAVRDPRIRFFRNERNVGIPAAHNFALPQARGEYVAFLDSDDVMVARRLEWQVAYLDSQPHVTAVGGTCRHMDESGRPYGRPIRYAARPEHVAVLLLFRIEVWKGSVTGRTAALRQYGFDTRVPLADDYDLWVRMSAAGERLANLPQVVGYYRRHAQQTTAMHRSRTRHEITRIVQEQLARLGIAADADDIHRHIRFARFSRTPKRKHLRWAAPWLRGIVEANRTAAVYRQEVLEQVVARMWRRACWASLRRTGPYGLVKLAAADLG